MKISPIPEGFHTVTPYLVVKEASSLIKFMKDGLEAELIACHKSPDGMIMNAVLKVGSSMVMLGDAMGDCPTIPAMLYLYVEDSDRLFQRAVKAGGKVIHELQDMFYGDRSGAVEDRFGNKWWIATRKENVSEDELAKRAAKAKKG